MASSYLVDGKRKFVVMQAVEKFMNVCRFDVSFRYGTTIEADAKLVAAAPELLTACESAFAHLNTREPAPGDEERLLDQLWRAISKAQNGEGGRRG